MKFYRYRPDAAGSYGENTIYVGEKTAHPCVISRLHYEFHLWPVEDMQTWLFHFVGTERLMNALEAMIPPVTGIEFDQVEISGDDQEFARVERKGRPDSALGMWFWFKIIGKAGHDDFGCLPTAKLVISERIKQLLIEGRMISNPSYSFSDYEPVEIP